MKSLRDALHDWRVAHTQMKKVVQALPRMIGAECVRVSKNNFKLQGYNTGSGVKNWEPRSEATNKRYDSRSGVKGTVYNSQNPILEQTRNLYNAIKYKIVNEKIVFIGVDLSLIPYAQKMNEGGPGKWGKNDTHTPPRQFLPYAGEPLNPAMLKAILKKVTFEREKALKTFGK